MAEKQPNFKPIFFSKGRVKMRINLRELNRRFMQAQDKLGEIVLEDIKRYMPEESGNLISSTKLRYNSHDIMTNAPYARFQHEGQVMVDPQTRSPWARRGVKKVLAGRPLTYRKPTATAHWTEVVVDENMDKWVDEIEEFLGGE